MALFAIGDPHLSLGSNKPMDVFGGRWALGLFLENPTQTAMDTGVMFLRILSPFYFVVSAKLVADGVLRGCEQMGQFMIATFTDLLLRVVLAMVLSKTALGATGIWCAWPVGWTIAATISLLFYRAGKWQARAIYREGAIDERGEA